MKKMIFLLCLLCIISLVGCEFNASDLGLPEDFVENILESMSNEQQSSGISKEVWLEMANEEVISNFTGEMSVLFIEEDSDAPYTETFKLADNKVVMADELITEPEVIDGFKSAIQTMILAIAKNYDKFEFNKTKNLYTAKDSITFKTTVLEYDATITMEDIQVEIDTDVHLTKLVCKMTHSFLEGGQPKTLIMNTEFTFYDYGTTVININE